jgi:hypothetical protein
VPSLATPDAQPVSDPVFAQESFKVISGMYDLAEDRVVEEFAVFQYGDQLL